MNNFDLPSNLFDLEAAIQAAGVLLREHMSWQTDYKRLLKLLYISDRECLRSGGYMITWDRSISTTFGPVPQKIDELMIGQAIDIVDWDKFFERRNTEIRLKEHPGIGSLSKFQIDILQAVAKKFIDFSDGELTQYCMTNYREYYSGCCLRPILVRDILLQIGFSLSKANDIMSEIGCRSMANKFFSTTDKPNKS